MKDLVLKEELETLEKEFQGKREKLIGGWG